MPVEVETTPVVVMEDHDGAYHAWKEAGVRDKILLHFDAHIDFNWIAPGADSLLQEKNLQDILSQIKKNPFWSSRPGSSEARVHLGNYIHEAIQSGMVREFIWVYPDSGSPEKQFRAVERILNKISAAFPAHFSVSEKAKGEFQGFIYGKPFRALPYSKISDLHLQEKVLLDIDLDFLIVESLHSKFYPFTDLGNPNAWLSPKDFCKKIFACDVKVEFVTLAYSVEEGYTPLPLKFLGAELAARLAGALSPEMERYYEDLREMKNLDLLAEEFSEEAAVHFQLALSCLEKGDLENARSHYQKAVALDPSYRTSYNHPGPVLSEMGFEKEAARSYGQMQLLDPEHPYYRLHEIKKLLWQKKWAEALALAESLSPPEKNNEVCLAKIECLVKLKKFDAARRELGNYSTGKDYLDFTFFQLKAKIAERLKLTDEAIEAYYGIIQRWMDSALTHFSLAKLYFFKGNAYKTRKHFLKALGFIFVAPWVRIIKRVRAAS